MIAFVNFLISSAAWLVQAVLVLLPKTPFVWDWGAFSPFLSVVSYFLPVAGMIESLLAFVTATAMWYVVRWLLRVVRYIG